MNRATVLVISSDTVRLSLPGEDGPIYVLQLGDVDQNVIIREGGELIFALLELCDGSRSFDQVLALLQERFDGDESLWAVQIPEALEALLAWKVLEVVKS